jgi:DNA polymerase alpha subunit A
MTRQSLPFHLSWRVFRAQEEDVQIYDEVTEDQYKKIVRGRLQKDDFVVDDGVGGYMDNGMDDWTGQTDDEGFDEEELEQKKRRKYSDTISSTILSTCR